MSFLLVDDFFRGLTKDYTPAIPVLDISPAETTISIDQLRNQDIMFRPTGSMQTFFPH